jgi:hypothetical protein
MDLETSLWSSSFEMGAKIYQEYLAVPQRYL